MTRIGFAPPAIDGFPVEARIDATNSRNGFANRSDELKVSPVLADMYFKASEELANEVAAKGGTYGISCPIGHAGPGHLPEELPRRASAPRCGGGR